MRPPLGAAFLHSQMSTIMFGEIGIRAAGDPERIWSGRYARRAETSYCFARVQGRRNRAFVQIVKFTTDGDALSKSR